MQLVARELLERPIVVVPDELEMIPPGNAVRVKACGRYAHLGPTTHDLAHELACPIAIRIKPQAGDVQPDLTRGPGARGPGGRRVASRWPREHLGSTCARSTSRPRRCRASPRSSRRRGCSRR